MKVHKLCSRNVATVVPTDDLTTAAEVMRDRHVGYLVVVEDEPVAGLQRPVGVLTDRDIVITVVARRADPNQLRVGDVMTRQPVLASETDAVSRALSDMRRIGVRRLPVVGDRGQLVGVLSLDDIIESLAEELGNVSGSIRNEQHIEGVLRP